MTRGRFVPLAILALLLMPIAAYACVGDENDFRTDVLFGSSVRDTENMNPDREERECEAKGHVWEDNGCTYHIDCNEQPWQVMCNDNDISTPPIITPTPEPPIEDCSHEGEGLDVCRPVTEDEEKEEDQIEIEEDSTVEDNEGESENNP